MNIRVEEGPVAHLTFTQETRVSALLEMLFFINYNYNFSFQTSTPLTVTHTSVCDPERIPLAESKTVFKLTRTHVEKNTHINLTARGE